MCSAASVSVAVFPASAVGDDGFAGGLADRQHRQRPGPVAGVGVFPLRIVADRLGDGDEARRAVFDRGFDRRVEAERFRVGLVRDLGDDDLAFDLGFGEGDGFFVFGFADVDEGRGRPGRAGGAGVEERSDRRRGDGGAFDREADRGRGEAREGEGLFADLEAGGGEGAGEFALRRGGSGGAAEVVGTRGVAFDRRHQRARREGAGGSGGRRSRRGRRGGAGRFGGDGDDWSDGRRGRGGGRRAGAGGGRRAGTGGSRRRGRLLESAACGPGRWRAVACPRRAPPAAAPCRSRRARRADRVGAVGRPAATGRVGARHPRGGAGGRPSPAPGPDAPCRSRGSDGPRTTTTLRLSDGFAGRCGARPTPSAEPARTSASRPAAATGDAQPSKPPHRSHTLNFSVGAWLKLDGENRPPKKAGNEAAARGSGQGQAAEPWPPRATAAA